MISKSACIIFSGYYGCLRGEEIGKSDLGAMRKYWKEAMEHLEYRHVPLILAGRFKGETGIKRFCQPLCAVTQNGRELGKWFGRYIGCLQSFGVTTGPLFRNEKGSRMGVAELDLHFHWVLTEVQRRFPNVIPDSVKVTDSYSTYRSLRRGATSEAQNVGISEIVIESNNRWRKKQRANGMKPGWSMIQHYTDAKVSIPTLIQFSRELPS